MPADGRARVIIENVRPCVDGGRFAVKRVVGEDVHVEADVFADGHDLLRAVLRHREQGKTEWTEIEMQHDVNDRWQVKFCAHALGLHEYTVSAWVDRFGSWRRDLKKKHDARQDASVELHGGAILLRALHSRAAGETAARLKRAAEILDTHEIPLAQRVETALDEELLQAARQADPREHAVELGFKIPVRIDREKARCSAWYELFPRSTSDDPAKHGRFRDVEAKLPHIAALGFDVLYMPPIHPIGTAFRKGKNNALSPGPDDVGSPWAIGGTDANGKPGGHTALHPELGTFDDFDRLLRAATAHDIEIALDIAFQCSPNHPWVKEHPAWFRQRTDGSIQYAENPPKKYQDIYPINFESDDWRNLWQAMRDVMLFWAQRGVRIFRVDNPHTKSFSFWEWVIAEIKTQYPDALFLSEAFTRPKLMYRLAKLGFTQSYTYFAWRQQPWEIEQYYAELTQTEIVEFFRSNAWPNTPDILTEELQTGGRGALMSRVLLAATLCANYGIYGPPYEAGEVQPREPGSEEYLNSEKYQVRQWRWDLSRPMSAFIQRINQIRRTHQALRQDRTLRFHRVDNAHIVCYSKSDPSGRDVILCAVNCNHHHEQWANTDLDLGALGLDEDEVFEVHDLLTNARYQWRGRNNTIRLDPQAIPAHVFAVRKLGHTESRETIR